MPHTNQNRESVIPRHHIVASLLAIVVIMICFSCSNSDSSYRTYDSIFHAYHKDSDNQEASILAMLHRADEENSRYGHALGYLDLALYKVHNGDMSKAIRNLELAQSAIDENDPLFVQAYADYVSANIMHDNMDIESAITYYQRAIERFEQIKDTGFLYYAYAGITLSYYDLGGENSQQNAAFYYKKALDIASTKAYNRMIIDSIYFVLKQGNAPKALSMWRQLGSERYAQDSTHAGSLSRYYEQGCIIYHALHQYDSALICLNMQDSIKRSRSDSRSQSYIISNRASLYMNLGRYHDAIGQYQQLVNLDTSDYSFTQLRLIGVGGIIDAYRELKNADSALFYLEQYTDLSRQVIANIRSNNIGIQSLKIQYQTQLDQASSKNSRIRLLLIISILVILLLVIILILYLRYRRSLEQNRKLKLEETERQLAQTQMKHAESQEQAITYANQMRQLANTLPKHIRSQMMLNLEQFQQQQDKNAWQQFESGFAEEHPEVKELLASHEPHLTATEIKICMLLYLNLSTKEIADMLHLSPESVKSSRKYIRKKFSLTDPSQTLNSYIQQLLSAKHS